MEQRSLRASRLRLLVPSFPLLLLLLCLSFSGSVEAYENYTVGGSLGWYDNLEKPGVNYQKWADSKSFTLGDFLTFNTDNNHSVVQTYNLSTYNLCDYDDASEKDTSQWAAADPSATVPHPVTVAVPLMKEGMTYFFSGDYDGEQCQNGQKFKVNVTYGQGLPPSLKAPSNDASPGPVSPDSGDDQSAPDTIIPSANFDHPKDSSNDNNDDDDDLKASLSLSLSKCVMLMDTTLVVILTLIALNRF